MTINKSSELKVVEEEAVATDLHAMHCHYNHADGCGWFYDKDFQHGTKGVYLTRAKYLIKRLSFEGAANAIHAIRSALQITDLH